MIATSYRPVSLGRIAAVYRRHWYGFWHSPPAVFDLFIWPCLDLFLWGLLTVFITKTGSSLPAPLGFLLGGVLLWDLLFRSNLGISTAFLDDTSWTRNILNFLVSPIRPSEYMVGAFAWSLTKLAVGWLVMTAIAWGLFHFMVFKVGFVLVVFAAVLAIFGMALSMAVIGLVLRFGHGADILAWGLAAVLMPLSAVYYPVSILPGWAQVMAKALPSSHIFESMRIVLAGGPAPWGRLGIAVLLDLVYLALGFTFAQRMFATLRRRGYITRYM